MTSSWFYPNLSGLQAKDLLMEKGFDGSYLTRPSNSNPGAFTLSVRRKDEVTHIKIQNQGDFYDLYGGEKFATLAELVQYYTKSQGELREKNGQLIHLKYPLYNEDITTERWFHGNITSKMSENLLMSKGRSGSFLVRESTRSPGDFVFSIKNNENTVTHVKIHSQEHKFDVGGGEKFDSLAALVEHYKMNPMVEVSGSVLHLKQPLNATRIMASAIGNRILELDKSNVNKAGFCEEFERLNVEESRSMHNRQEGNKPENRCKNRYKNIRPTDETRVKLTDGDPSIPGSDYINANFIYSELDGELRKSYIATQSCLPNTIKDFWRMVWCQNCRIIVMMTKLIEKGKGKCTKYWPEDTITHKIPTGFLKITLKSTEKHPDYELRKFELTKINCSHEHLVTKLENDDQYELFNTRYRRDSNFSYDIQNSSMGDLSMDNVSLNTMTDTSLSDINSLSSSHNISGSNNNGFNPSGHINNYSNRSNQLTAGKVNNAFSNSDNSSLSSVFTTSTTITARGEDPYDIKDQPPTPPSSPSHTVITGATSIQPIIKTEPQEPSSDLKTLHISNDSQSNTLRSTTQSTLQISQPNLTPTNSNQINSNDMLPPPQFAKEYTTETRTIYHYQFTSWPDTFVPKDPGPVLTLLQDVHDRQDSIDNPGPIVVHCSAGIGRTGTLIVIDLIRNQIRYQGLNCDIDIPRTIVKARSYRSGLVQSELQYRFIYRAICHYVQTLSLMLQDRHKNQRLGHDYLNIRYPVENNLDPSASQTSISLAESALDLNSEVIGSQIDVAPPVIIDAPIGMNPQSCNLYRACCVIEKSNISSSSLKPQYRLPQQNNFTFANPNQFTDDSIPPIIPTRPPRLSENYNSQQNYQNL